MMINLELLPEVFKNFRKLLKDKMKSLPIQKIRNQSKEFLKKIIQRILRQIHILLYRKVSLFKVKRRVKT